MIFQIFNREPPNSLVLCEVNDSELVLMKLSFALWDDLDELEQLASDPT